MTERSNGGEDKRRLILDAAVRVFARRGFHTCRIGEIGEEAGLAHVLRAWRRDRDLVRVVRQIVCGGLAADRATVPV